MKKPRPKKCKFCKETYQPDRPLTEVCGVKCAIALAGVKRQKKQKKEDKLRLEELRPLSHWLNLTQGVFNEYIRLRDDREPCISCGTMVTNEWCAGHYRTRGAASQHRFSEFNCHKQCNRYCNMELSGNIINYRPRLIDKIGLAEVEALENDNSTKRWTREELDELRKVYRAKIKGML